MAELAAKGPVNDLVEMGVNLTKLVKEEELAKYPAQLAAAVAAQEDAKVEAADEGEMADADGEGEEGEGNEDDGGKDGAADAAARGESVRNKDADALLGEYLERDLIPLDSKHEIAGVYTPREDVIPMDVE
jgi:hypothetical protein